MRLSQIAQALVKGIQNTENVFGAISMGMYFVLMVLGVSDVIGRYVFNRPILGTLELSQILMVGLVVLSWGHTQAKRAHVRVELVVARLSPRGQAIMSFLMSFLSLALFSAVAWQGTVLAMEYLRSHRYIPYLGIPSGAVQFLVPLGASLICLELIIQMLHFLPGMRKVD